MEPGSLPQTQVPRLFTLLDTNGDGVISQKEFLQAMEPERNTRVLTPQRPPGPAPRRAWGWGQTPQEPVTSKAEPCERSTLPDPVMISPKTELHAAGSERWGGETASPDSSPRLRSEASPRGAEADMPPVMLRLMEAIVAEEVAGLGECLSLCSSKSRTLKLLGFQHLHFDARLQGFLESRACTVLRPVADALLLVRGLLGFREAQGRRHATAFFGAGRVQETNRKGHVMLRLFPLLLCARGDGNLRGQPQLPEDYTQCGVLGQRRETSRIVHGKDASECVWRWQVSLGSESNGPFCGGTLISPEWVLTAAHCVMRIRSSCQVQGLRVGAGGWKRREDLARSLHAVERRVQTVYVHPLYQDNVDHDYDFALLRLDKPVPINECIGVACLPTSTDDVGEECSITGWGTLVASGPTPDVLQQAKVKILSTEDCEANYTETITGSMLCAAGRSSDGITDTCQGDSGGPLVCREEERYVLRGVTSWGQGCAFEGFPGVYGRVQSVLSWIEDGMAGKVHKAHAEVAKEDDFSQLDFNGFMWTVVTGPCSVDESGCLLSPGFPEPYGVNEECKVAVNASAAVPIAVANFTTEPGFDQLYVDCRPFSGLSGPENVTPSAVFWTSDDTVVEAGWRLCPT
ncbi:unnamed protein product [Effrenium voratum]|uniref:Uncharacterized protein n=1 Tax=Effrenium voratum TaxID=2562239 RepID=A0AA36NII0_9DINO|nr:unnamed protein product [Effrenium voratum]